MDSPDTLGNAGKSHPSERAKEGHPIRFKEGSDLSGAVLHVEYSLTDEVGTSLVALVDHIIAWSVVYDSKYVDEGATSRSELRIFRSER
jgi:hypothetical protein